MPIINITNQKQESYPSGAYSPLGESYGKHIVLFESHHGLCIRDFERNMYDDSDFFMVVWNEEKKCAEQIMFATTRGWTYPAYHSSPDATSEVMEKYKQWLNDEEVKRRWKERQKHIKLRKECKLDNYHQLIKLLNIYGCSAYGYRGLPSGEKWYAVEKLLKTKKFRSKFRQNMCNQIREWVASKNNQYPTPLSPRQLECIIY